MLTKLDEIEQSAVSSLKSEVEDEPALEAWRVAYLGRSSPLMGVFDRLGQVPKEERPAIGRRANEVKRALESALSEKAEELRQAVTMREIEGLSYEEIAEVMNCPIGTVRSRIFRAREAISAKVKPLLENQSGKRW